MADGLAGFPGRYYLNLETYRRDGRTVQTPVWFAADGPVLYVYTNAESGKAKRVRRDGSCRIAPCDMRGRVTGDWTGATARLVDGEAFATGMRLLDRKYFPWKKLLDLGRRLRGTKGQPAVIALSAP